MNNDADKELGMNLLHVFSRSVLVDARSARRAEVDGELVADFLGE